MKKIAYTFSFVFFATLLSQAQNGTPTVQAQPAQSIPATGIDMNHATKQDSKTELQKPGKSSEEKGSIQPAAPKSTRMAINEKGVPASKDTKTTTSTPAKEQKKNNPGQPTTTENK